MVQLPFTAQEFFAVFGRYNEAVWPMQWVLYGFAALVVANIMDHRRPRVVLALLALFWLWAGLVYHLLFFVAINPVATVFGVAFITQAALLAWCAHTRATTFNVLPTRVASRIGKALVGYALVGYPLLGYVVGHRYPRLPTLGAPCPTTIFTLGVLISTFGEIPWWVMVVPVAWTVVGTSAALQLGVPQDLGLTAAGLVTLVVWAGRSRSRSAAPPLRA